jgi:heat shock protein HtpX
MEMCVDNPRSGFEDMFATHPSIDSRVDALVRMAGGRDPGRVALDDTGAAYELNQDGEPIALPPRPAQADADSAQPSSPQPGAPPASGSSSGPWGPRQ